MHRTLKKTGAAKTSDTVQCVRKRVFGSSDPIDKSDLFYDKSDGKYYKNMYEIRYCADCQIYPDEYKKYLSLSQKDRSAHTILLAELPDGVTYIKSPQPLESAEKGGPTYARPLETNHYAGMLVHRGVEELSPPPMVRLYSEAEMTHAANLASTMTDAEKYRRFRGIGSQGAPDRGESLTKAPLIKATEYDDRDNVLARYSSKDKSSNNDTKAAFMAGRRMAVEHRRRYDSDADVESMESEKKAAIDEEFDSAIRAQAAARKAPGASITRDMIARNFNKGYDAVNKGLSGMQAVLAEREGFDSMEVSYGGHTGDMTFRRIPHPDFLPYRQYSLIQSTFFWIPGASSIDNAKALFEFFVAKSHKLKPGGIIRIVSFSGESSGDASWRDKPNQYQDAAEWVCKKLRKTGYTDVGITLLQSAEGKAQSYSDKLAEEGLGPEESESDRPSYRPLWTDTRRRVGGGGEKRDNLIIQARKIG